MGALEFVFRQYNTDPMNKLPSHGVHIWQPGIIIIDSQQSGTDILLFWYLPDLSVVYQPCVYDTYLY